MAGYFIYSIIALYFLTQIAIYITDRFKVKKTPEKEWVNPQMAIDNYIEAMSVETSGIARKKSLLKYTIEEIFDQWEAYLFEKKSTGELKHLIEMYRGIYIFKNSFVEDNIADEVNSIAKKEFRTIEEQEKFYSFHRELKITDLNNDFNALIKHLL